jgi:hypothetical protein
MSNVRIGRELDEGLKEERKGKIIDHKDYPTFRMRGLVT